MLLQINNAEFRYGDVTILKNVNAEVNERDSIGLVGANGTGKSTLLKCIVGELSLFSGDIYKKSNLSLGYLKQNSDFRSQNSLFEEMRTVFDYEHKLLENIAVTAEQLSRAEYGTAEYDKVAEKYHRLSLEADAREAYDTELKIKTVLTGMGLIDFADRIVATLSGGEKTKAALCKLLLERPELMILDEPTNHLDYKTLDWLESFLSDKKSALIVVSHDRYFLDKLCDRIWDVENLSVSAYVGNYTKYKLLRAEKRLVAERAYDKQQIEIAKLNDYIDRNKVRASTANMAKSREKTLAKMEIAEAPVKDARPPRFRFRFTTEPSEKVLSVRALTLGFDGRTLMDKVSLELKRGSKTALIGLNGTGKSTLLKRIGALDPHDAGKIIFGKNVRMGYYDQENLNLDYKLRVLDQLWFDNTRMSQTEVRGLLAAVQLGADDVYKTVGDLSGGERAKLGLCMLTAKDFNLLLLDEPTNHLDLPSREALEEALADYGGTLLFVSHDRYFVNNVAGAVAELEDKDLKFYEGNYDAFSLAKKNQNVPAAESVCEKTEKSAASVSSYRNGKQRAEEVNRANRIKELEKKLTSLESTENALLYEIALPEVASDYKSLLSATKQLEEVKSQYEQTLKEWEKASAEV